MRVLFIGGTGVISSACSQLAVERGIDLYLLNRGATQRVPPPGAQIIRADIRNVEETRRALGALQFDAVVNWIAYTPAHIQTDLELFRERTAQYVFISSASVYQKPPVSLPITESAALFNPHWQYSRDKIACENILTHAYRETQFPATIVRPSHTYDQTKIPLPGKWTAMERMRRGKPVIVHGDGTSLWTLTHHRDFAQGFLGLLGNTHALGEAFHITSDEILTWNQIAEILARAAGATPRFIHIASEFIAAFDAEWGAGLLGDKAHSAIFDNTKLKRAVPDFVAAIPFTQGAREMLAWFDADPARRVVDPQLDQVMDRIIAANDAGLRAAR